MGAFNAIAFIGFTALVAVLSWLWTRGTDAGSGEGYYLGGRSLTAPVIAGSLLLTNLSTEQIVGLTGQAYTHGILVMAWETLAAIAMVVTALVLLPRYLQRGVSTIPAFLEDRYDSQTKTATSLLFLTGYAVILLPIVLYSGALALSEMFGVAEALGVSDTAALWITIWAIGIIGSIYAIFGGLKAVAVSDTINAIGLFIGGLLLPLFGLMAIGGGSVAEGLSILWTENPEKFEIIGGPDDPVPFATIFTGMMLVQLFYWGTNQAIVQRALAAKDLREGQKGLLFAGVLKILGPIIVVLPGLIAWHMFPGELDTGDRAYGRLVNEVLPYPLRGFFAAVLFGAILSSFNSALNSSVTLFGNDLYRQYIRPAAGDRATIRAGKMFGILLAIASMTIAPFIANAPQGLFGYLQEVNGCYSIPILTIILVGIFTRRVPPIAAKIALASGVGLYILSQFVLKPFVVGADNYPHYLHVMAMLFVLNVVIMLVIGRIRPRATAFVAEDSGHVDLARWPLAIPVGGAIVAIVASTYVIFA